MMPASARTSPVHPEGEESVVGPRERPFANEQYSANNQRGEERPKGRSPDSSVEERDNGRNPVGRGRNHRQSREQKVVLGRGLGELLRRLSDVASFADRARVADAYLLARCPALHSVSAVTQAARSVQSCGGCVRVSHLAHQAGLGSALGALDRHRPRPRISRSDARGARFQAPFRQQPDCNLRSSRYVCTARIDFRR